MSARSDKFAPRADFAGVCAVWKASVVPCFLLA
jgi:hypothetical protein